MKLRRDDVCTRGSFHSEREMENKDKWYGKLWDVAANIGKNFSKIACIVSVPVIVASCTCSRIELEGDARMHDVPVDVSHENAPDVHDAVGEDVTHEDVIEGDTSEEELPLVCEDLLERSRINNLIGDELNRRLDDRVANNPENTGTAYLLSASEVSENANPFSDGEGGSLGPTEIFMHRITGDTFSPLANSTISDVSAAETYIESQNIWIRGRNYYDEPPNEVVGDMRFVAYTMGFKNIAGDFGIPVCTESVGGDYTYCKSGAEDADYTYATETHRVGIQFLGSEWLVTEMVPPVIEVNNETKVQNGGYVKLGKEAVSSRLDIGAEIVIDGLRFVLTDLEEHGEICFAIISVFDEAGNELKREKVEPGETKEFTINGEVYRIHVWDTATCDEADISILSDEIKIEDGQKLDPDTDRFQGWYSVVGWKNKNASAILANPNPDHLRKITIYADDVTEVSSNSETTLLRGEGITFPTDNFDLCYAGLDITDENRSALAFSLERDYDLEISEEYGPYDYETGDYVSCTVYAPYVMVTMASSDEKVKFYVHDSMDVPAIGDISYIAASGALCGGGIGYLDDGAVLTEDEFSDYHHGIREYTTSHSMLLVYNSDENVWETFGAVYALKWEDSSYGGRTVDLEPDFVFTIAENTMPSLFSEEGSAYSSFAFDGNSLNLEIRDMETGGTFFKADHVSYKAAGPVFSRVFMAGGSITERGSVFKTIDDNEVVFDTANELGYSVFYIGKRE